MRPQNGIQSSFSRAAIFAPLLTIFLLFTGCAAMHNTPTVSYLTVTPNAASIALGETAQFKVEATYSNGATEDVTNSASWRTMNTKVATVNAAGMVSSVSEGTTYLFASASGTSTAASLSVSKAALTGISITAPASPILLGQTAQLRAIGTYTDKSVQDITNEVSWGAAQPAVLSVSATGLVVSKAVGNTDVTASLNSVSASSQIAVSPAGLVSVAVLGKDAVVALGVTEQFSALGVYTDGSTADLTGVANWMSSAPGVVSFNAPGIAVARAVGSASISASVGGVVGGANLSVSSAALVSIAVGVSRASLPLGSTGQLTATGTFTDGSTRDLTGSATWTSASPGVVAISASGAVTAKSLGVAGISASSAGITASVNLSVVSAALVSIAVNASHSALPLGSLGQMTATGTYTDGSTQDLTGLATWSSTSPAIVAVSGGGAITAKSLGVAAVSASSSGVTGSASLNVLPAALVAIAVNASHASLPLGSTGQLTATGTFTDSSTKDITGSATWTSAAPGVVAVANDGTVTAKSTGATAVSASSSGITGSMNLSVSAAALVSLQVSSMSVAVPVGDTLQLGAMGTFTDGSLQDLTASVKWTSSSPEVATVQSSGLVTGLATGSATVTASSGTVRAVETLTISAPVLSSLALSPAGPTVPLGGSLQLTVVGTYSDGSTQDVTQQISWNLDNAAIASITPGGLVTGLQVGTSGIEATLNGVQTSDTLTVQPLLSVGYFNATSGIDSTIRITNPGTTGQNLCGMLYVFDQSQQMSECCGCTILPDGLLSLSLQKNLLSNPLTGVASKAGTIMLVTADPSSNPSCNASAITPAGTAIAWSTHLSAPQAGSTLSAEEPFSSSPLGATLSSALQAQCSFIQQLGSGQGLCTCGSN